MDNFFPKLFTIFGVSVIHNGPMTLKREIIFAVNVFICVCILLIQFKDHNYLYDQKEVIGQVTDMLQTLLPTFVHLFVLSQTVLKRKNQRNLELVLKKIYRDLTRFPETSSDINIALRKGNYTIFFVMNVICLTSELIVLYLVNNDEGPWKVTVRLKTFALIIIRLNDFQFMTYVLQINKALKQINLHLSSQTRNIHLIKDVLIDVWKAQDILNKRFGISLFYTVTSNFVVCLMSSYWIMYNVYNGRYDALWYAVASILFITSPIINLSVMYYICEQCIQEVRMQSMFDTFNIF